MATQLWFAGICDQVLARLHAWYVRYESGAVHSTRPFMMHDGNIVDLVQKRIHHVPWKRQELQKLYDALVALRPKHELTADVKKVLDNVEKCPLAAGGYRLVPMIYYRDDVKELIDVMLEAKNGASETPEAMMEKARESGKGLWE